ncbi:MAG: hypothetical protein GW795_08125 [Cyanobacteria bacterium]|nr:hypothetical protein [Cyanobacteria bacterium CG_2015-16_32_12]NCO78378.1 hypothetical protein [Cyanobacteria bacterium CG_2015-22_32_23]NCQ02947.1 hypothetical protein [Cyanobacteria bacterium CG_2015-09_32_10]NCQ41846.1 hypothetical protein [Cyanobacteria bacterium CG_2015-04_32_10]NCS85879.1 hypothetical protein [Cyanobacteria bacterium CG_2015-02_32_10]
MTNSEENSSQDIDLQTDIIEHRKFSLAELIGREGGNFLKGESPVPKILQLKTEIIFFINNNLQDLSGALQAVLQDYVNNEDDKISRYQDTPLKALSLMIEEVINNDNFFYEFVKEVDLKSGQMTGDRPYFQKPGQPPHPNDEYSHKSVKIQLINLLKIINKNGDKI